MNLNRILSKLIFLLVLLPLAGCDYFSAAEERKIIVRVNETYLYEEDIEALIDENTSPEDSSLIVSSYITRWATQQLFIDRALLNLPQKQQEEFDDLVENYRNEIYTNAYKEAIVSKQLDTVFSEEEIEEYYEQNKENFKLNEDLVKLRYINLDKNNTNRDKIKRGIIRFNDEDKAELEDLALQFKNYSINDSIWVRTKAVYDKIGPLSAEDRSQLLKKTNYLQLEDSLNVYLIYVNDVLTRNEQAPLEYASATIEQILLNKRKQDLIKELEKDITKDAIKNNEFEMYY